MYNYPVIVCIGSEKVSGDALGPTVGTILIQDYGLKAYVYGTLDRSVNGVNINKFLKFIDNIHSGSLIITVDAAVGEKKEIGMIKYKEEGINAGAALGHNNPVKGIGIVGIVGENKGNIMANLLSADYNSVNKLSRKIARLIYNWINQVEKQLFI